MKIDITQAGAIVQDFTNRTIKILSKQNFVMWEQRYTSEESFNKSFIKMSRKFSKELVRREKELNKV